MLHKIMALVRHKERQREFKVPAGYRLVPEIPSEAHIESMCMRFDHSHGMKHDFPLPESDENFRMRQDFNRRVVRQIYEEATGQGFHKLVNQDERQRCYHAWRPIGEIHGRSVTQCIKCGAVCGASVLDRSHEYATVPSFDDGVTIMLHRWTVKLGPEQEPISVDDGFEVVRSESDGPRGASHD